MRFRGKHIPDSPYRHIKRGAAAAAVLFIISILSLNIYNTLILHGIEVDRNAYSLKNGFPLFHDMDAYIKLAESYPYNAGVRLTVHTMQIGESFWNITARYGISIDTLIAANPFLKSLRPKEGLKLIIPSKDGVLFAFDNVLDVYRMQKQLGEKSKLEGEYRPALFKLFSNDDVRLVFFQGAKPVLLNKPMGKLYAHKNIFIMPVDRGHYTSMFGERVDPFIHMMAFHNGLDIQARYGSPVKASRSGIVTFSGWREGYGNTVEIQHKDGYSTLYAHCSELISKKGDFVLQGNTVALVGSTGRSTGPHVHFMLIHHGVVLNPLTVIW